MWHSQIFLLGLSSRSAVFFFVLRFLRRETAAGNSRPLFHAAAFDLYDYIYNYIHDYKYDCMYGYIYDYIYDYILFKNVSNLLYN